MWCNTQLSAKPTRLWTTMAMIGASATMEAGPIMKTIGGA
jgi:hypothetical protein